MYVRINNSTVILPVVCSMFDWGRPVILSVPNIIHRISATTSVPVNFSLPQLYVQHYPHCVQLYANVQVPR